MINGRIILFIFLLINTCFADYYDDCDPDTIPTSNPIDCHDRISEDDKEDYNVHCCHLTYDRGTITYGCELLNEDYYNDIDAYKDGLLNDDSGLKDVKIVCNQSFININLVLLLFYILLF